MPTVNHYHVSENYFEGYWYICIHLMVILLVEKKQLASMSKDQEPEEFCHHLICI